MKESYSFMQGHNVIWITLNGLPKAFTFANDMRKWDKLSQQQREDWYLSGEGRTFEFRG
jgi:hypothetical protein